MLRRRIVRATKGGTGATAILDAADPAGAVVVAGVVDDLTDGGAAVAEAEATASVTAATCHPPSMLRRTVPKKRP